MCGRARCTHRAGDISRACYIDDGSIPTVQMDRYRPSFNVSPGSYLPVVRREEGSGGQGAVIHCMKWGLIPSFTNKTEKPDHYKMFNARSESVCEKASFRRLIPKNRCLVAVEGFYEWKKDGSKRQPYYIHLKDGRPLVFAALYDTWGNAEGEIVYTFTILTTCSSSALQWLHGRMPVILGNKGSTDAWLNGSSSSEFNTMLKPYEDPDLVWYPVTPAMGKPSFNGPECIKEIEMKTEGKNPILKFFSKKRTDNELESDAQVKSSSKELAKTNPVENLKEEPSTEGNTEVPTGLQRDNNDSKLDVSSVLHRGAEKCGTKRDYEEFSGESKPTTSNIDKLGRSLGRKKGNLTDAGDKQKTLFSYFGKS